MNLDPLPAPADDDVAEAEPGPPPEHAGERMRQRTTALLGEFREQLHRVEVNTEIGQYDASQQQEVCDTIADMQALLLQRLHASFSRNTPANQRLSRQNRH